MPKRKVKVAIFHCGFIYSGGGERIVLEEARGLRKKGYEVEVYAPTLDCKKCFPELVKEVGVKTFFPSLIDKLPLRNALRMLASSFLAPFLSLRFRNFDVFIGANQPGAWIAFCMARVLRKPYLVYLNQPNRVVYPRPVDRKYGWYATVKDYQFLYKFFQIIRPLVAWLDRLSVTASEALLVNGGYIGGVIKNVYATKTFDVPAGSYFSPLKSLNLSPNFAFSGRIKIGRKTITKPYVLITNRHDPQKRFDYVVRALKKVLEEVPKVSLVIPGPFTDYTQNLVNLARNLKIKRKVILLGQVSEADLQKLYKHAAVYCYPSPEEDFGLGPLEAGGWGIPTVAWNHAGPTVTVEDGVTGFLAYPYRVKDYAQKMLTLLKNPLLRVKMGKAAWERTKNEFSWEGHVDILEKSIFQVV